MLESLENVEFFKVVERIERLKELVDASKREFVDFEAGDVSKEIVEIAS